jgi:hypothetical protein
MYSLAKSLSTVALSLGLALPALAAPLQNYPGAMCVPVSGAARVTANGHAENGAAATATLLCPVVRENPLSMGNANGDIWLTDAHYSGNICCSSRAKDPGGQPVRFTSDKCTTGVQGNVSLNFSGPAASGTWSSRFYLCTVPGTYSGNASAVLAYRSEPLP